MPGDAGPHQEYNILLEETSNTWNNIGFVVIKNRIKKNWLQMRKTWPIFYIRHIYGIENCEDKSGDNYEKFDLSECPF